MDFPLASMDFCSIKFKTKWKIYFMLCQQTTLPGQVHLLFFQNLLPGAAGRKNTGLVG
jgi:hypothetical protein